MKTIKTEVIWEYYDNGQLRIETYYIDGNLYNTNGIAYKLWNNNEQSNGNLHNPNGPAFKHWNDNGQLISESYYINGKYLTKKQFDNRNNSCNGKIIEVNGKSMN